MSPPLLLLAPIEPCRTGNGLAMRVAGFAEGAIPDWEVTVAVVPVAGHLPRPCPWPASTLVTVVAPPERGALAREAAALLADAGWA